LEGPAPPVSAGSPIPAAARYALKAATVLARSPGEVLPLARLARDAGVPAGSLGDVLRAMARRGLIRSRSGPRGGYRLALPAARITLGGILEAAGGPATTGRCPLHAGACYARVACPMHDAWTRAMTDWRRALDAVSLRDLTRDLDEAETVDRLLSSAR
jgi:Rrf2 family protein